jgi:choline dehydrogenase-like flavoprotein
VGRELPALHRRGLRGDEVSRPREHPRQQEDRHGRRPWTYEEFHPWFEAAEIDWGVSGKARRTAGKKGAKPWSQEPVRDSYEYPMEPLLLHGSTKFLTDTFDKAGMPAYVGPRAINSRTFDSRPGCSYCGYDQFFGCPTNSRANAQNTMLHSAGLTGRMDLRTGHCVTRVEHQNGRAKGVWYKTEPNGEEKFLGAKVVILSAQPIQSARLFLLSHVPDPHDMVGHYLAYHTKANLDFTFPKLKPWDVGRISPRTAVGTLQHRDLYVINDRKTYLRRAASSRFTTPTRAFRRCGTSKARRWAWEGERVGQRAGRLSQ